MKSLIKGKVSVIVPVYNTPKQYLEGCIASILSQDYPDVELIIVDDGSTDGATTSYLRSLPQNEKLLLVSKKNEGVSEARLTGLYSASGEMVMFTDSDDELMPGCIKRLVELKNEYMTDAVIAQDEVRNTIPAISEIKGNKALLNSLFENVESSFGWALWGKLFDTVLMQYYYKAYKDIFYGEDLLVCAEYFSNCSSAVIVNEKLYMYRRDNEQSAMHQAKSPKKLSLILMWKNFAQIYKSRNAMDCYDKIMANYCDSLLSGYLQCEYYRYDNYRVIMKDIKLEMKKQLPEIMKNPHVNGKIRYIIATYALWVFKLKRRLKGKDA